MASPSLNFESRYVTKQLDEPRLASESPDLGLFSRKSFSIGATCLRCGETIAIADSVCTMLS